MKPITPIVTLKVFRNPMIKIINTIPRIKIRNISGIQHGLHSTRLIE